jgi:hypothetical protein
MNISNHVPADSVIVIAGVSYVVSVPRIKELIELVNVLKDRVIARAKKDCAGLPVAVQTDLMRNAVEHARKIEFRSSEFVAAFDSIEAEAYAFYLLIRRNQSSITADQALEIFGANYAEARDKVVDLLCKAMGVDPNPTPAAGAIPPQSTEAGK